MRKSLLASSIAVGLLCGTSANAADFVLDIVPTAEQSARFEDGRQLIDSSAQASAARIYEPRQQTPKQSGFRVYVMNDGVKPFDFGPENITIRFADGTTLAMLSYRDLLKQQERAEAWQAVAVGLAAAGRSMEAASAGTSYGTVQSSGSTYGTFGATPFAARSSGISTFSTYNAGAAAAARANADAETSRQIEQMQLNQAAQRDDLAQVMKLTTVDPGQPFGGIVQYMVPRAVQSSKVALPIIIEVRAGDEVHKFNATLARSRR